MDRCPICDGRRVLAGIACGRGVCAPFEVPCTVCGGSGELLPHVANAYRERERIAEERRKERLDSMLSAREFARKKGMAPIAYSRWERALDIEIPS